MKIVSSIKREWFLIGMVCAILLAIAFPNLGKSEGVLSLDIITSMGVIFVFFLHGLGLSPQAIKTGMLNWRLHLYIQSATFVLYPLLWCVFDSILLSIIPSVLAFGFCYLFVLPSTISSSVAMTSIAKGNVAGAIFNASLSSILGVVITPLFIHFFTGIGNTEMDMMNSILSIIKQLLLPMIAGQILRPLLRSYIEKYSSIVNKLDKYVILLIIYNAFCNSINDRIWGSFSFSTLMLSIAICCLTLVLVQKLIQWGAKQCNFRLEDEIAAVFCGTKKTLAAGIPMAKAIFGTDPRLGMFLLPIMLYHPIQLFYCAFLAKQYAKRFVNLKSGK